MSPVRIVTDSTAHFRDPDFPGRCGVTVMPLTIHFGKNSFLEGIDIDTDAYFRRLESGGPLASAASPSAESFLSLYEEMGKSGEPILSIHLSSKLSHRNTARPLPDHRH
jgi:fatty acid-binding protein DegV